MNFYKSLIIFFLSLFSTTVSGSGYFQQEVNYTIHVSLNDRKHELSAHEKISYTNNSPVTLNELYFHLWPNAYRDRNTILSKEIFLSGDDRMIGAPDKDLGYIDSLEFTVDGEKVKWKTLDDTIDVCKIILNKPLRSGDSITIATPFRVKIPASYLSRLGHEGQAYFITQWFPKPAVFDMNGWNYFPYLDQGEYYSEFGKYDVFISLPENYVLGATGVMMNAEKETAWLEKKDSLTRSVKSFPDSMSTPVSSKDIKQIHFHQENVHDFAWFADKRWNVLMEKIEIPGSDKKLSSFAFFTNKEANYWMKVPGYIRDGINFFCGVIGVYPYETLTMVDVGNAMGGGMEYPAISTIGNYGDPFELEITVLHEIGHNWLYGILANNERCHAWMDEGINNFYETRYVYTKYAGDSDFQNESTNFRAGTLFGFNTKINHRKRQYLSYMANARVNNDQSPDQCANRLSNESYRGDVYYKTSISFDYLKFYLGDSLFDACMRSYYETWKFRHPQPEDLKSVFETVSGKKLDWLFDDLLRSNKKLDYRINCLKKKNNDLAEVRLQNTQSVSAPVCINVLKENKIVGSKWIEGFAGKMTFDVPCADCDAVRIDAAEKAPELFQDNNFSRLNGILKKTEKISLSFGLHKEDPMRTFINYFPVIGWNNYNKLMAGVVIHNISPFEEKFEYAIMPMYAFGTGNLAGGGQLSYHIYPDNSIIRRITLRGGISHYALGEDYYENVSRDFTYSGTMYYTKLDSRIIFSLFQKNPQEHFKNEITLRNILISRDIPYIYNYAVVNKNFNYWQIEYRRENTNPLKSSLQRINVTYSDDFINASGELKNFFTYGKRNKGFEIRMFAGIVDVTNSSSGIDYRMSLSGRTGPSHDLSNMGAGDYLFDEVFLGRSENSGLLSHQYVNDYAGFRTPTLFYRLAEKWMFGFNTSTTLPGKIPFRLFANVGSFDNSDQDGAYGKISWEIGVDLPVIKDIFVISLPFAYSEDIKYVIDNEDLKTGDLIRFELHLNLLNPLTFVKKFYTD